MLDKIPHINTEVLNTPNLQKELDLFKEMKNGEKYYLHIIKNIEIDRDNPHNSYIMYLAGKVDKIDLNSPPKIIPGRYALPDIDTDFPPFFRENIISYAKSKFGEDRVAQIATFGSLKGRSALLEVFRVTGSVDYDTATKISQSLPEESKIKDDLDKDEAESIIYWILENMPESVKEYAYLKDGEICGDYATEFKLAIELEGCYKSIGLHAAGIVISNKPLGDICPLIKTGDRYATGFNMKDVEKIGLPKIDILGLAALEKLMTVNELLKLGKIIQDKNGYYV